MLAWPIGLAGPLASLEIHTKRKYLNSHPIACTSSAETYFRLCSITHDHVGKAKAGRVTKPA